MKPTVLVMSYYDALATAPPLKRLAPLAEVRRIAPIESPTPARLIAALKGATVAVVAGEPFTAEVFEKLPQLRMLCCDGVGVDHVDLDAATAHGVIVSNAPFVHEANGDFVMGLLIALLRKIVIADRGVREGQWQQRALYASRDVHGSTLGLLGFGRVAQCVARRASGFDMNVLAYSPRIDHDRARTLGVAIVSFEDLLVHSDVLSIHVALHAQTRGLIGRDELARMKPGAFLINSSRGAVIDEQALVAALKSGRLAGAALDVLSSEPPPIDHPLLGMDNVLLSPHVGSDTLGTFARVFECLADDIILFLEGHVPRHVVNRRVFDRTVAERISL